MNELKVLNIAYEYNTPINSVNICTEEEFNDKLKPFDGDVKYKAANLAAHGWDVVWFRDTNRDTNEEYIFIGSSYDKSGTFYHVDGSTRKPSDMFIGLIYGSEKFNGKLDVSKINPEGARFMRNFYALIQAHRMINYVELHDIITKEQTEWKKAFTKKKRMLQNFWNNLHEYD